MPRFVVLFHQTPPGFPRASHWDLMVEEQGALKTWALAAEPTQTDPQTATWLADHRLAYLEYEGPLSEQRGDVTRWDHGLCELEVRSSTAWRIRFRGTRIDGVATLIRISASDRDFRYVYSPSST